MGSVGMDREHSQASENEWSSKGWSNPAGFLARCAVFATNILELLNLVQVPGKPSDNSSALAEHRSHVYQRGLLEILRSVIPAAGEKGFVFNDRTQHGCLAQLIVSILSMDYEEV